MALLPNKPSDVRNSIQSLLADLPAQTQNDRDCTHCGGAMTYFGATFWLEGTEEAWDLRLPVCYRCAEPTEKEKEIVMNTGIAKSCSASVWVELYQAALFEVDKSKLKQRIADAEMALVLRARELFQARGDHIEEETAVDDAMYALHALRSIAENQQPSVRAIISENELAA